MKRHSTMTLQKRGVVIYSAHHGRYLPVAKPLPVAQPVEVGINIDTLKAKIVPKIKLKLTFATPKEK